MGGSCEIDHFGHSILCNYYQQVRHALLGETSSDNVQSQILKSLFIVRPDGGLTIDFKSAMAPGEHIFNDGIVYFILQFRAS